MSDKATLHIALETPRLLLRPLAVEDATAMARLADNWNVVRHLSVLPFPYERHHASAFIGHILSRPVTTTFAIALRGRHREMIGVMGFALPENGIADSFGYWLGEPFWGQGYATEAACAVITYGIAHLGACEVLAGCRPCNPASRNVLEKSGFSRIGRGTMPSKALGTDTPIDLFSLTRDAWNNRRDSVVPVTIVTGDACAVASGV